MVAYTFLQCYLMTPSYIVWFLCSFVHSFLQTHYQYSMTYLFIQPLDVLVGRDSSVDIATRYGLHGPGFEFRWGEIFRTRPDRPWGPPSLLHNGYQVFPGCKAAEAWRLPPTTSSTEVKGRVELLLYSPCWTSWPVLG